MPYEGPGDPDKIAAAIRESGLTFREISLRAGCSDTSISNYARGFRKPAARRLTMIAEALGIDVRSLLA